MTEAFRITARRGGKQASPSSLQRFDGSRARVNQAIKLTKKVTKSGKSGIAMTKQIAMIDLRIGAATSKAKLTEWSSILDKDLLVGNPTREQLIKKFEEKGNTISFVLTYKGDDVYCFPCKMQTLDLNLYQNLVTTCTFFSRVQKNPIDCLITYGMSEATPAYIKSQGFAGLPSSIAKIAIEDLAEERSMESLVKFKVATLRKADQAPKPTSKPPPIPTTTLPSVITSASFVSSAQAEPHSATLPEVTTYTRTFPSAPIFTQSSTSQWPNAPRRVKFEDDLNWAKFDEPKPEQKFSSFFDANSRPNSAYFSETKREPIFETFSATQSSSGPKVEINNLTNDKPFGKIKIKCYDSSKDLAKWLENSYVVLQYLGVKSIDRIIGVLLAELPETEMSRAIEELSNHPRITNFQDFKKILLKSLAISDSEKERLLEKLSFTQDFTMRTFFFRIKSLLNNLYGEDLGNVALERIALQHFRKKLPISVKNEPSFLAMLEKTRDLNEILSMAQTLYDIKASRTPVEVNHFQSPNKQKDFRKPQIKCWHCDKVGHRKSECRKRLREESDKTKGETKDDKKDKNVIICTRCLKSGHRSESCRVRL